MSTFLSLHAYISGYVQGICFRSATQSCATQLNLTGWVKNLSDGRVEVFACGEREQIEKLKKWLYKGPPAAQVTQVVCEEEPWKEYPNFAIRY